VPRRSKFKIRPADPRRDVLHALERAGTPLSPEELAKRLRVQKSERRAFNAALADLERAGEVVQNRAGALLVAKRLALVAGRIEGHPDGHGFPYPDDGGARVFLAPAGFARYARRPGRGRSAGATAVAARWAASSGSSAPAAASSAGCMPSTVVPGAGGPAHRAILVPKAKSAPPRWGRWSPST
jgi:exoribonuclease R